MVLILHLLTTTGAVQGTDTVTVSKMFHPMIKPYALSYLLFSDFVDYVTIELYIADAINRILLPSFLQVGWDCSQVQLKVLLADHVQIIIRHYLPICLPFLLHLQLKDNYYHKLPDSLFCQYILFTVIYPYIIKMYLQTGGFNYFCIDIQCQ